MTSEPCVFCGTDSVATCQACSRRICNRDMVIGGASVASWAAHVELGMECRAGMAPVRLQHPQGDSLDQIPGGAYAAGFLAGTPRCVGCRASDGDKAVRDEAEAETDQARRFDALSDELTQTADPVRLLELITSGENRIRFARWRDVWKAATTDINLEPDLELVEMSLRIPTFGGPALSVEQRLRGWVAGDIHREEPLDGEVGLYRFRSQVIVGEDGECRTISTNQNTKATDGDGRWFAIKAGASAPTVVRRRGEKARSSLGSYREPATWHWQGGERVSFLTGDGLQLSGIAAMAKLAPRFQAALSA